MNLFHMTNACLRIDPLLGAGVGQNGPPSRSPCWLLLLDPGWRQLLSDKHSMVWWKGFLWLLRSLFHVPIIHIEPFYELSK